MTTTTARRTIVAAVLMPAALLLAAPSALAASPAAPTDKVIALTSQQLTDAGFPEKPNLTGWGGGGTASLPTNSAAPWADVIINGKAPAFTSPGQLLTMSRFMPTTTTGTGTFKELNITTVVKSDRTYSMHFQLGFPGLYGYRVGYSTTGTSPEFVGFQFQFTTTGTATGTPKGSASAVTLTSKQLTKAGFTKTANVVGWGGTATLSTSKAKAGTPVKISGTAPKEVVPGTVLTLKRFAATDKKGSGSFAPVGDVTTTVQEDGTFSLTFEINELGRYGYTLGTGLNDQWVGIEFQLKTT
ncbi:MAG: hypothetical protein WCP95_11670 [Actinomycetes bacterium]